MINQLINHGLTGLLTLIKHHDLILPVLIRGLPWQVQRGLSPRRLTGQSEDLAPRRSVSKPSGASNAKYRYQKHNKYRVDSGSVIVL